MEQRILGRTGRTVSCVGIGTWQLGSDWGDVPEADAIATLEGALDAGITFIDTADNYGDGISEQVIGRVLANHASDPPFVATKMGQLGPQEVGEFTQARFREWIAQSCEHLGVARSIWCSCTARRRRCSSATPSTRTSMSWSQRG